MTAQQTTTMDFDIIVPYSPDDHSAEQITVESKTFRVDFEMVGSTAVLDHMEGAITNAEFTAVLDHVAQLPMVQAVDPEV